MTLTDRSGTLQNLPVPVREGTRLEILERATQLFAAKGYEATSLRDIAGAVGCSKAALLYHFHGKAEILAAALHPAGTMLSELARELQALPPDRRIASGVATLVELAVRHRAMVGVLPEILPFRDHRPELAAIVATGQLVSDLLTDPDDPASGPSVTFALTGLTALCRNATDLDDDALRRVLELALTRLLRPRPAH